MNKQTKNIDLLTKQIAHRIGNPVSVSVVLATIESFGVREIDSRLDYGVQNLETLASNIYKELKDLSKYSQLRNQKELAENNSDLVPVSGYLHTKLKLFSKYYPLGILHLLPVFIQIVAIILFGYSLWTYVKFNQLQSTAVVLGVIAGMVISGGYVQVIGKQMSFYYNYKEFALMKNSLQYILKTAFLSAISFGVVILLFNWLMPFFPVSFLLIALCYAILISYLLIVLATLHPIQERWVISIAVGAGTVVALLAILFTDINIYLSHWLGIIVVIVIIQAYLKYYFANRITNKAQSRQKIRVSSLIYHNYQHFIYGLLLYIFFFTDRILAWSVSINEKLPLLVYYEKDYEIGMDIAILMFLLLAGVLEYAIASFTNFIAIEQRKISFLKIKDYGSKLMKLYWQNIALLLLSSLFIFLLIYLIVTASWGYEGQFKEVLNHLSLKVCIIGSIAYILLAWAMLNSLYMLCLNRPNPIVKALFISCLVNLLVGFMFSRLISYEYSVIGLLVGSLVYLLLSLKACMNYYKKLDYYYYAAF